MKKELIEWIKEWFYLESDSAKGIIIGISGGKDSTICAKLCVEAIGAENVYGLLMPNGEQKDIDDSLKVCKLLGIKYSIVNIKDVVDALIGKGNFTEEAKINIVPRIRMTTLYSFGQTMNYRVCGTGNLSEGLVGYCTKWGDMASDFNPIGNLTKTEVVQLGDELQLPYELVHKTPTDGLGSQNDEEKIGITYDCIDGIIRGDIVSKEDSYKYRNLYAKAKHKITPIPMPYYDYAASRIEYSETSSINNICD